MASILRTWYIALWFVLRYAGHISWWDSTRKGSGRGKLVGIPSHLSLSDLARKNTGHLVTFAFQINSKYFLSLSMFQAIFEIQILSEIQIKLSILYLTWQPFPSTPHTAVNSNYSSNSKWGFWKYISINFFKTIIGGIRIKEPKTLVEKYC